MHTKFRIFDFTVIKKILAVPAIILLMVPSLYCQLPKKKRLIRPAPKAKEEIIKPEPKTQEEILTSLKTPATAYQENLLSRILTAMAVKTANGPVILFPVADSNKDMGPSYGIMPIIPLRDKNTKLIKSVIVPSANYNRYLGASLTYRHYIFPDEKRFFILRASLSHEVEREFIIYYYTPRLFGTDIRLSVEAKNWITGKPSFYGYGARSAIKDRANYALNMTGEEFIIDFPVIKHLFLNLNHSYYFKKISDGPVDTMRVSGRFPADYAVASKRKDFINNRFSLVYDDTDHPFLPKIGTYAGAAVTYSNKRLGSDFNYRTYSFQLKHYYNHKEEGRFVTAVHYLLQFQRGDELPFYATAQLGESTGLRMAGDGRFVDRGKLVFNIEERITLTRSPFMKFISETEIAPFLDVGTVFAKPSDFRARKLKYSPGFAVRIVIRPQVVGTGEFAFGSEGTNAIIKVGYPF
ncbi:MAG: outer membrane protein assembly factor [Elusimicrobia bacterium]|nr:outer membrane protein assembly factor [Elusimicrobiota bacterium]